MGYLKKTVKGVSWTGGQRLITRGISMGKTAFLARLLTPYQFGLYGIASLVLAFLEILTETGINVFLVQEKRNVNEYIDTTWTVSIMRGIFVSLVILLIAPLVSSFFNSPESVGILRLISTLPLIRGFINPSLAKLQKSLMFKQEFLLGSSLFFSQAIAAVVLAYLTKRPESIVWGLIISAFLEVWLSFLVVKPRPALNFNPRTFKKILKRGKWVTGFGVLEYIFRQGDDVIVGKLLGEASLGVYQVAYKISSLPISEISNTVSRVTFPVFTKISSDTVRLKKAFLKSIGVVSLSSLLLGVAVYLFADQLVLLLLGKDWLSAAPVLRALSLFGILRAISNSFTALFLSLERQDCVATVSFFSTLVLLISIMPAIKLFGLPGAAYAAVFGTLVALSFNLYYYRKIFN